MSNSLTGLSSLRVAQIAWNHPQLDHYAIIVLWALLTRLQNNPTTWPSVRLLAQDLKISRDTVFGAFAQIRAAGIMISVRRPGGRGLLEWRLNVSRAELEALIENYLERNKAGREKRADRSVSSTSRPQPPVDVGHRSTKSVGRPEPLVDPPPVAESDDYRSATATQNMQYKEREDAMHAVCPLDAGHQYRSHEGEHAGPLAPSSGKFSRTPERLPCIAGLNGSGDLVLGHLKGLSDGRHTEIQLIRLVEPLVREYGPAAVARGVQDLANKGERVTNLEKAVASYVKGARVSASTSGAKKPAAPRAPPDRQTWLNEQMERGATQVALAARSERDNGVPDGDAMRLLDSQYNEAFLRP